MSATLSWFNSGLGTKTNTTVASLFTDLNTLITSKSGDSDFKWQVASVNDSATPFYIVLKRKDASAGRILLVVFTSAPANNNSAVLDQAPSTNALFGAWFPAGNTDTPSNLTAASGTIMGSDTGVVKFWAGMGISTIYAANFKPVYFDSAEGVLFGFGDPATNQLYMAGAGDLIVDASDVAYPCVFSYGVQSVLSFGSEAGGMMDWTVSAALAGSTARCVRTNYGSANRTYFHGFRPSGPWANRPQDANDILVDSGASLAWFAPVQLIGLTKGEGAVLKYRQLAWGPGALSAFTTYNTTGPVVAARRFCHATVGGAGYPWATNFKL